MRSIARPIERVVMLMALSLLAGACNSGDRTTPGSPADSHAAPAATSDPSAGSAARMMAGALPQSM